MEERKIDGRAASIPGKRGSIELRRRDALVDLIRAKAPPPALVALDLRGNVALEGCSEAVAKALLDTRKSRKPAVEELWFPINDQQEGSGAVDLVQQLEYAEVMGHDEL